MISTKKTFLAMAVLLLTISSVMAGEPYKNFKVAVYSRAYETVKMGDLSYIEPIWDEVTRQVHVDKIYLETHRDLLIVDEATLLKAKKIFEDRGVKTAGGITLTVNESNNFETFCYTNPEHRKKVKEIVEFTAKHFDELILDDFFFTSCKCDLCIKAGTYQLGIMYTSNQNGKIAVSVNDQDATGPLLIPSTFVAEDSVAWRQWHHWNYIDSISQVDLKEGLQTLTIHTVEIGQMNYDYIDFKWIK